MLIGTLIPPKTLNWPENVGQTVSLRYDLRAWWCAAAHETFSVDVEL
jgi:hypothetical protein